MIIIENGKVRQPTRDEQFAEVRRLLWDGDGIRAAAEARSMGLTHAEKLSLESHVIDLARKAVGGATPKERQPRVITYSDVIDTFGVKPRRLWGLMPIVNSVADSLEKLYPLGAAHIRKSWGLQK